MDSKAKIGGVTIASIAGAAGFFTALDKMTVSEEELAEKLADTCIARIELVRADVARLDSRMDHNVEVRKGKWQKLEALWEEREQ